LLSVLYGFMPGVSLRRLGVTEKSFFPKFAECLPALFWSLFRKLAYSFFET